MYKVFFDGEVIECEAGVLLRDALMSAGKPPHNGNARWFNCKGFGTCGTCAVEIEGDLPPLNAKERWRLNFPPHDAAHGLRLACQIVVTQDLRVTKHGGFWGQDVGDSSSNKDATEPES